MSEADEPVGRAILYDKTLALGQYPIRVSVKETGWDCAADTLPFYIAMGKDEKAWAYTSRASVEALIEALQEALPLAKEPA